MSTGPTLLSLIKIQSIPQMISLSICSSQQGLSGLASSANQICKETLFVPGPRRGSPDVNLEELSNTIHQIFTRERGDPLRATNILFITFSLWHFPTPSPSSSTSLPPRGFLAPVEHFLSKLQQSILCQMCFRLALKKINPHSCQVQREGRWNM